MHGIKFFKKFLMPCGLCAATPIVKPAPPPSNCPTPCELDEKKLIRPSELPIYTLGSPSKVDQCPTPVNCEPSYLEQGFGTIRKSLSGVFTQYQHITESITDKIDTGVAHSESLYEYLKEESNVLPRMGAIGIGALSGLILSLRGGAFKKTLYTTTGGLLVASLCYPKQAAEGVDLAKHYANIGYNFAYGNTEDPLDKEPESCNVTSTQRNMQKKKRKKFSVKPGDEQLEIQFPELPKLKIPTSLNGLFDQVVETGAVAGETIGNLASKASEYLSESKEAKSSEDKPKQS
ncbi:MICOS complex subunit MIC27 isoform X1 [Neodiprion lecontei]|uniref:MICOS complex subunit n=1 Tax=Neodiprion lecontei TaxID=441921 RepID=A0ABM3FER3_NEOLC|nr:MICOS complex subunit MIC27 isoform X1 [Neodiprion lecontei]